jgi:histone H3/H4
MKILTRKGILSIKPENVKMAKESWNSLDEEIFNITKGVILKSKTVANENNRKTIFDEDIKEGAKRYLESFEGDILSPLKARIDDWFTKEKERRELNASTGIYSAEVKK